MSRKSRYTTAVGEIVRDIAALVDQNDRHLIIYGGIGRGVAILIGRFIRIHTRFSQKERDLDWTCALFDGIKTSIVASFNSNVRRIVRCFGQEPSSGCNFWAKRRLE